MPAHPRNVKQQGRSGILHLSRLEQLQALPQSLPRKINLPCGPFCTDVFGYFSNHQFHRYYSWKPNPSSAAVDAFYQNWTGPGLSAPPPLCLVSWCISKMINSGGSLVLVAKVCLLQPWYASLLTHCCEEHHLLAPSPPCR